jgi:hypothetical protein
LKKIFHCNNKIFELEKEKSDIEND